MTCPFYHPWCGIEKLCLGCAQRKRTEPKEPPASDGWQQYAPKAWELTIPPFIAHLWEHVGRRFYLEVVMHLPDFRVICNGREYPTMVAAKEAAREIIERTRSIVAGDVGLRAACAFGHFDDMDGPSLLWHAAEYLEELGGDPHTVGALREKARLEREALA